MLLVILPPLVLSLALGVVQSFTALLRPQPAFLLAPGWLWLPCTVGVGHNPDTVALMEGPEVCRANNAPLRVIPHFGKVTKDHGKSSTHKHW